MGAVVTLDDVTATASFVTFLRSYDDSIPYVHLSVCVCVCL